MSIRWLVPTAVAMSRRERSPMPLRASSATTASNNSCFLMDESVPFGTCTTWYTAYPEGAPHEDENIPGSEDGRAARRRVPLHRRLSRAPPARWLPPTGFHGSDDLEGRGRRRDGAELDRRCRRSTAARERGHQ